MNNSEDKEAAGKLPLEQQGPAFSAAEIKYSLAVNAATEQCMQAFIPELAKYYNDLMEEGQKLWEEMLPFARCTLAPEYNVINLYSTIVMETLSVLGEFNENPLELDRYIHEYTSDDLEAAEKALAQVKEYTKPVAMATKAKTNFDFTISVRLGKVEYKLSSTSVEIEYVNGVAARVAYNWKTKQMELGIGAGLEEKIEIGTDEVGKFGAGASVKGYVNVVLDMRNQTVTDVYTSTEVKASIFAGTKTLETGGTVNISQMGRGASLSTSAKAEVGNYGVEHTKEIIKLE